MSGTNNDCITCASNCIYCTVASQCTTGQCVTGYTYGPNNLCVQMPYQYSVGSAHSTTGIVTCTTCNSNYLINSQNCGGNN